MANLLKVMVVILLLTAIAAFVVQLAVLFPQRTLIKERTQKLENGVSKVVGTLKDSLPEEVQAEVKFKGANLKAATKDDLPKLDKELTLANQAAQSVVQQWEYTKTDLENTRQDLENTKADLEATQAELDEKKSEIVRLNDTIRQKNEDIAERDRQVAMLEDEKTSLEANITNLEEEKLSLEEATAQLEADKALLQTQLEKCEGDLNKEEGNIRMPEGATGHIVYVNPEWNFVVIDIGSQGDAQVGATMIVHRDDNMIGKLRITDVRDDVSICEVMQDYQRAELREGDDVLH